MSYSSELQIVELDSDRNPSRELDLVGGGLPEQGAAWPNESVLPTTWYPGNPREATQQVLVTKAMPSSWKGEWNLTRLSRSPCRFIDAGGAIEVISSPGRLVDVLEDFQLRGQRLRVTWVVNSDDPNVARTVVREGRISNFTPSYVRSTDINWEITFTWQSRGGVQQKVAASRANNYDSAATALSNSVKAVIAAAASKVLKANPDIRNSATRFTLGQLEQLASYPQKLVGSITGALGRLVNDFAAVGDLVQKFRSLPFSVASTAVDFARNTVYLGNQFVDQMNRTPAEQRTLSNGVADLTRAWKAFGDVEDAQVVANRRAQEAQDQLRDLASKNPGRGEVGVAQTASTHPSDILAIRIARVGDTPQSLSKFYYGTIDHEVEILRANRLPWYQASFVPGSIVVIPALSSAKGG